MTIDKTGQVTDPNLNEILSRIHENALGVEYKDAVPTKMEDGKIVVSETSAGVKSVSFKTAEGNILTLGIAATVTAPSFSVHKNGTDQTNIATGSTPIKVTFSTELFDTNDDFDSSRFTPTVEGKYILTGMVRWNSLASGSLSRAEIWKNGSVLHWGSAVIAGGTNLACSSVSAVVTANGSTDYFELYAYHSDNTGNRDIEGTAYQTYFTGSFLYAG